MIDPAPTTGTPATQHRESPGSTGRNTAQGSEQALGRLAGSSWRDESRPQPNLSRPEPRNPQPEEHPRTDRAARINAAIDDIDEAKRLIQRAWESRGLGVGITLPLAGADVNLTEARRAYVAELGDATRKERAGA